MQYRQPFFFNDTATTEIYTLSLPDALPISPAGEVEDDEVVFCHVGEALDEAGDGVRGFERRNDSFGAREQARRIERSEEHTSELQSQSNLVCRLLLEKKNQYPYTGHAQQST